MATWSSFEKDKLITEGWRDFFKKKEKSVGTYPASELTTIINLISNLAKKLNIDVDTSKIVDEFEAILKSKNYNLQEQEDKIMIGGDVDLNLSNAPTLKAFMDAVAAQNPEGLNILLKALKRGAFKVSNYQPAASTEQTPTEEPKQAEPAMVETDLPIQITVDEFSKFIDESDFQTIKKIFNKLGVNKEAEEIKQKFKSLLPTFFNSFDKALEGSDVGEYFRLQAQVKETINIKDRLGNYSDPQSNLYIFLFGALLKNYIKKRSDEVDAIVGDLPNEVLTQLQNSVSGLTNKTLKSILGSKRDAGKPTAEPPSTSDKKEPEVESNFDGETGIPISKEGRDSIINQIAKTNSADEFFDLYDKLANSKFSNDKDSFAKAVKDSDHLRISGFGTNDAWRSVIRQKFVNLVIKDKLLKKLTEIGSAKEFKEIYNVLHGANPKRNSFDKIMSIAKDNPQEALEYISIFGGDEKYRDPIKDNFKTLFLKDQTQEEPVATEPEVNQEPATEPQATEEPLKIITKILGEKGVSEEKVNAFIDDLKNMGVIQEIAPNTLRTNLKMSTAEWKQFSKNHPEVIEAIRQLKGRSKKAKALQAQFKDALSKIITREKMPPMPNIRRKKKSTDASKSKNDSTPAAATPAEPEPEASSPEPEARQEPAPEATPEPEPEPARQEEEPREKSSDPRFTKRTTKRIKDYYNRLEIGKKLTNKFNIWKEPIERLDGVQSIEKFEFDKAGEKSGKSVETFDTDKDGLYLITLTNGDQFGLPKHTNDVSTLGFGFEWDNQIGVYDPLNKVIKLAKIKDGKIIEKGKITWGERGPKVSESKLEESLMLRWKTIAGIK